jgi:hypothetical protein
MASQPHFFNGYRCFGLVLALPYRNFQGAAFADWWRGADARLTLRALFSPFQQ